MTYSIGTQLLNKTTGETITISNITEKSVSILAGSDFTYKANKNTMSKLTIKKPLFENNILEGRLVIQ